MSHISQIVIFNKKDLCDHVSNRPASDLPNVFVSSKMMVINYLLRLYLLMKSKGN